MSRKNKIIVSVVGIVVVLLALLGLTYAYYLTRIQGNTNTNSISVTTADLRLVYRDGSANILETEIEPSDTVYTKEFTVKNEGNVNIDYGVYLIDVINTFERKDDIKYKMTCRTDGTLPCNQITSDTTFPSGITQMVTATIEPTKTHTYTFSFTYKDTGTDQSVDMGKELSAKIQIFGKHVDGEYYPYEEGTLAYKMINNALNAIGTATILSDPITILGDPSAENERVLSKVEDDYGYSYYYRGNVNDNYVNFAGMCWRIINIDESANIKLVLEDGNAECGRDSGLEPEPGLEVLGHIVYQEDYLVEQGYWFPLWFRGYGYRYELTGDYNVDVSFKNNYHAKVLDAWLNGGDVSDSYYAPATLSKKDIDQTKLVDAEWCNDISLSRIDETTDSDDYIPKIFLRETPYLKCDMIGINDTKAEKYRNNIGLLTRDELMFAGLSTKNISSSYISFYSMSQTMANGIYRLCNNSNCIQNLGGIGGIEAIYGKEGYLLSYTYTDYNSLIEWITPSIVLKNNVSFTGNGIIEDPFVIE